MEEKCDVTMCVMFCQHMLCAASNSVVCWAEQHFSLFVLHARTPNPSLLFQTNDNITHQSPAFCSISGHMMPQDRMAPSNIDQLTTWGHIIPVQRARGMGVWGGGVVCVQGVDCICAR